VSLLAGIPALKKLMPVSKKARGRASAKRGAGDNGIKGKLIAGSIVVGALLLLWKRRQARKGGRSLRNPQGVGPAHVPGVQRGEELVAKEGTEAPGHAAGRLVGSVEPA
jgi:hypothetical protein